MKTARVLVFAATISLSATALGQAASGLHEEKAQLQQKLAAEKAELDLIKSQKLSALEVVEWVEGLARAAEARSESMKVQVRQLQSRIKKAEANEKLSRSALDDSMRRLAPRLRAMDRLSRQNKLDVLLSASDFRSLVWRSRAMGTLVERDLELLRQTQRLARSQERALQRLDRLKILLAERMDRVDEEAERSARQQAALIDVLNYLQAETRQSSRLVKELEQAERKLSQLVADIEEGPASSGFGALRGRLSFPADGLVEMGFGRVVNPKFNTVTFQKGLDIRAAPGLPVKAIAEGKVVYTNWLRGYGNLLIVDHGGGFHSLMAHLEGFSRAVGDEVKPGDEVGRVGDTGSLKGAYLYFEIRHRGEAIDPAPWFGTN